MMFHNTQQVLLSCTKFKIEFGDSNNPILLYPNRTKKNRETNMEGDVEK